MAHGPQPRGLAKLSLSSSCVVPHQHGTHWSTLLQRTSLPQNGDEADNRFSRRAGRCSIQLTLKCVSTFRLQQRTRIDPIVSAEVSAVYCPVNSLANPACLSKFAITWSAAVARV